MELNSKGFTFIELLVAMVVIMVIGVIVGSIIFSSLRGTNKTNAITVVRQNGNNAIEQMSKMIRNAKKIDDPLNCVTPINSAYITFTNFDNTQTTLQCCNALSPRTIKSFGLGGSCATGSRFVDTDTGVTLVDCSFTCSQNTSFDAKTINISFSLSPFAAPGVTLVQEQQAALGPVFFQTSIVLRNIAR